MTTPHPEPTHVDLVRALESIDHTGLLGHEHDVHGSGEDHEPHGANDMSQLGVDTSRQDGTDGEEIVAELEGWSREQLQAEIVKLRRLAGLKEGSEPRSVGPSASAGPSGSGTTGAGASAGTSANDGIGASTSILAPDTLHAASSAATAAAVAAAAAANLDPTLIESEHHDHLSRPGGILPPQERDTTVDAGGPSDEAGGKKKRKRRATASEPAEKKLKERNTVNGKRLEKERRTELAKALRNKMRASVGMQQNSSPIPAPSNALSEETREFSPYVPDWSRTLDDANLAWIAKIIEEVQAEYAAGQYPLIPHGDMAQDIVHTTACTAFTNMCKRYANENHPAREERREKYIKKRRRWARKDLKQKRRSRSSADPAFSDLSLPPSALHIDYMSSEYSSAGEDEPEADLPGLAYQQKESWREMVEEAQAAGPLNEGKGWGPSVVPKVLEVRRPRWRSQQLNEIYARLDAHADAIADSRANGHLNASSSSSTTRAGHVAPSHARFYLPAELARKGKAPRDMGEPWMWASGVTGVWPVDVVGGWMGDVDGGEEVVMGEAERLGLVNALEGL
ncbi:hypothetical protein IAT38_006425 [Cryptococcus sp. DSM 104549]